MQKRPARVSAGTRSAKAVAAYIAAAPMDARAKLRQMRAIVRKASPKALEKISYGIPHYAYKGRLAYFAAFRDHVSFFPASSSLLDDFMRQAGKYRTGKGTLRFALDAPLPAALIRKIVLAKVKRNEAKAMKTCSRGHRCLGPGPCPACWPGSKKKK